MQSHPMNILLVDDQPSVRLHLAQQLRMKGHTTLEAESADQALQLFGEHKVDLVLLDVIMPGNDGYWLARQLREREGSRWTPIIFLSALDKEIDLWRGIQAGGDDYLIKPISPVVLSAKLHAMQRLIRMRNQLMRTSEELHIANQRLTHISVQDQLTKLGNRRGFDDRLHEAVRQCRRDQHALTLILCDVDHFKRYNDTLGHVQGDRCLEHIGRILSTVCRRPMDYVARYGGEEFGMILPNTSRSGAMTFARALLQLMGNQPMPHPDSPVSNVVTISGGITTVVPDDDTNVQHLLMRADEALYSAKAQGRNRFFSFEMQMDTFEHLMAPPAATLTAQATP
ncbi:diguanylate cyclase [Aquabacterium lacunae]|uniref:diguanylate cyclase n=1 Tax=Aquabacterium lacunae TaxID=2528630 RepID=A0A4Q9H548_9BURK|nr:diguanylate cyclase [Aquabacterium lacunae]TBO32347.1 diguanylate cyclase [Aquabacterium lacunae]